MSGSYTSCRFCYLNFLTFTIPNDRRFRPKIPTQSNLSVTGSHCKNSQLIRAKSAPQAPIFSSNR